MEELKMESEIEIEIDTVQVTIIFNVGSNLK